MGSDTEKDDSSGKAPWAGKDPSEWPTCQYTAVNPPIWIRIDPDYNVMVSFDKEFWEAVLMA